MGRIRTVKPELFRHEGLYELEQETGLPIRIAFVGLWSIADREGRFRWRPRQMKLDILPYDDIDLSKVLDALASAGFVRKYEFDGEAYGDIPSWSKHQVINQREAASSLPAFDESNAAHVRARAVVAAAQEGPFPVNAYQAHRETVLARDGGACVRCGQTDELTIDHIFPVSAGGTHALTNLRTLCKSCNSARPVAGKELIDDLAKDGLTFEDMPRTCMHVLARVEGEGEGEQEGNRKRKGKGREVPAADASAAREVWDSYAHAYGLRYQAAPIRNAKVNAQLAQFCKRVPLDEAPAIAAFYVAHNNAYYVRRGHAVEGLLADAEKLRTEWATNRRVTETQARQADRTQANGDVWGRLIAEAEANEAREA